MRFIAAVSALGFALSIDTSLAAAYRFKEVNIAGATSVSVVGINDYGQITGSYVSAGAPNGAGFLGTPTNITTLPAVQPSFGGFPTLGIPVPTGLNDAGTVIGTYFAGDQVNMFVWNGSAYSGENAETVSVTPKFPPFIGTAGHLSFNDYIGDGVFYADFGTLAALTSERFAGSPLVASINKNFQISGEFVTFAGGTTETNAVFVGNAKKIAPLLPPDATASYGGWLNDAGQVAGSYTDAKGGLHGFLYTAGAYKSFDMPTKPLALTVQGIDVAGRVVGTYEDAQGSYGFVYGGGTVTKLGAFLRKASIQVSISRATDRIAISATLPGGAKSFLATCVAGTGC